MFQFDLSQRSDLNTSLSEPERKETEAAYGMVITYNAATAAHYLVPCHIMSQLAFSRPCPYSIYGTGMVLVWYWYTGIYIYCTGNIV